MAISGGTFGSVIKFSNPMAQMGNPLAKMGKPIETAPKTPVESIGTSGQGRANAYRGVGQMVSTKA